MPNYVLDLPTLLSIFQEQKRTGELRAADVRLKGREAFQARVVFILGKDVSYAMADAQGHPVAEGDAAKHVLIRAGRLEWEWLPQQSPVQRTPPPEHVEQRNELALVFQRNQRPLNDLSSLPRTYQRAILLVDGQRTVAQIAVLLPSVPVQEIYRILSELHGRGWLQLK